MRLPTDEAWTWSVDTDGWYEELHNLPTIELGRRVAAALWAADPTPTSKRLTKTYGEVET